MREESERHEEHELPEFSQSAALTLGIELELQIIGGQDYNLIGAAPDLLREMAGRKHPGEVKPEITDSMIELSTDICRDYADAVGQLRAIRNELVHQADRLGILLSGGGTHPFQHWGQQAIFDAPRFHHLSQLYGYLAKQFTVFGQHVHIGCACPDKALWLLHAFSRYIPHLIALSAASPFVQGIDTGFQSARLNSVFAFPLSGRAPFVLSWADFAVYFRKMIATGVVKSMKDFYWDIRPKPEFGTIELRVIGDDILRTMAAVEMHAYDLGATEALNLLRTEVLLRRNGATEIRASFDRESSLEEVVRQGSEAWAGRLP